MDQVDQQLAIGNRWLGDGCQLRNVFPSLEKQSKAAIGQRLDVVLPYHHVSNSIAETFRQVPLQTLIAPL